MFYEDLSCPKFLGNTNWVFPINPDFYSVDDSGNAVFYESRLLRISKSSDVLYAEFSETNSEVIAELHLYSKDYKLNRIIALRNRNIINNSIYGFINHIEIQNPISVADYWYKVILKSNISNIKIFGL